MSKMIDGHFCRLYGNDNTHLILTEEAEHIYSNTDPLRIWEREVDVENDDGEIVGTEYRYTMEGVITTQDHRGRALWLTETEVNDELYSLAPDLDQFVCDLFDEAFDVAELTVEDAADDLSRFRRDGWILPVGITPQEFADAWNELVRRSV